MARQPRFLLAGHPHLVEQRGHNGAPIVLDVDDRRQWLDMLRDAAASTRVVLHAWGLGAGCFRLLVTPPAPDALSRMMQTLGRRYVGAFNARHHRSGTLWDGRFLACLVESGECALTSMRYVESLSGVEGGLSSLPHHLGDEVDPAISDLPAYWALGNTPFDRHATYRARSDAGATVAERAAIERALKSGRPFGSADFVAALQRGTGTVLVPRPRGRPAHH
jgi:putative transposase